MECPDWARPLLRREPPEGVRVVGRSTPVLAFGDPTGVRVATLGLNPSAQEFLGNGALLAGAQRRFETLDSLGVPHDQVGLAGSEDGVVDAAWAGLCSYFQRRPYRRWFRVLEEILAALDASYWRSTACHLDLSPWATDPTWSRLDAVERDALLTDGRPVLEALLRSAQPALLLVNGRRVLDELSAAFGLRLEVVGRLAGPGARTTELRAGAGPLGIPSFGWSVNLQSSFGVTLGLRGDIARAACAWHLGSGTARLSGRSCETMPSSNGGGPRSSQMVES